MPPEQLADSNNLVWIRHNTHGFPLILNQNVERFRILVIGNANAGKTTILKKVCHAKGREPVCLNVSESYHPLAASSMCSLFLALVRFRVGTVTFGPYNIDLHPPMMIHSLLLFSVENTTSNISFNIQQLMALSFMTPAGSKRVVVTS
jgi:septin family protein